ncbi:MAG: T9SS type A sorting domain-containing protein, partial [Bacteroidia bacterium]|nr:T9SS type A sorting domain-containing protein [Bacteroidia bacterium]
LERQIVVIQPVGIEPELQVGKFSLYPNPASDAVTLEVEFGKPTDATIELWEIRGTKVRSWEITKEQTYRKTFSVSDLSSGVYLLKVNTSNGTIRQRLIVH